MTVSKPVDELAVISVTECRALLATEEIGRLAVVAGGGPHVVPVNYVFDGRAIVFRTETGTKLDAAGHVPAAFEVDSFDRERRTGWSVVVHGRLEEIDRYRGPAFERVQQLPVEPWAGGEKAHWVRLVATSVTGRRVGQPQ
ncbi:MAG: pyridoxamine 5'-phosphate oxidase family protein [Actinomycetota bacterium]